MNSTEIEEITKLLKERKELISARLFYKDIKNVKKILEMPEWEEEKFKGLLT